MGYFIFALMIGIIGVTISLYIIGKDDTKLKKID